MRTRLAATLALALLAGGCGVSDPYNDRPRAQPAQATPTPTSTVGADQRTAGQVPPELATPADGEPAPETALAGQPDAAVVRALLRRFADAYVNWSADGLARQRRELADLASGTLRERLLKTAESIQSDTGRGSSDQTNTGSVEGILIQRGKPILVITRENTTVGTSAGTEIHQRAYFVYTASVARVGGAWKVTDWWRST